LLDLMAEVIGTGAAGAQLLQTAIGIFRHIRKAYKEHKGLADDLKKYSLELESIRDLSQSVRNERVLQGPEVSKTLSKLELLEVKLCKWLDRVDPGDKKSLRRFADQLVRGEGDRKKLDRIMKELDGVKRDLNLVMNMHSIKVSEIIRKAIIANGDNKTGRAKNRSLVGGANLTATNALTEKQKTLEEDDSSTAADDTSTEDDSSAEDDTPTEDSNSDNSTHEKPRSPKTRRIKRNRVGRGATMVNAPLGDKDLWANVQILEIEDNVCEENGFMYNYRNNANGLALAEKDRKAKIIEDREQILWERDNKVGRYAHLA